MFGPLNIGQSMEEARKNAIKALETVSLVDKKEENPYDLSLSERKLVSIASILSMDTDIVILDEPTIAQDYLGKAKIRSIVHELVQRGKLVIHHYARYGFCGRSVSKELLCLVRGSFCWMVPHVKFSQKRTY